MVDRRYQPAVVGGGLTQGHQIAPIRRSHQPGREDESLAGHADLAHHYGLSPLARGHLPRDARRERCGGVALHPDERLRHGTGGDQRHDLGLRQVDTERFGQGLPQAHVRSPIVEVGHDQAVLLSQPPRRQQRSEGADAEEAHRSPRRRPYTQCREREHATLGRPAPREQPADAAGWRRRDAPAGPRLGATALE